MPGATFRGRFVWHELMTTDTKAAIAFYTKVVGWKAQGWPQDPSYMMLVAKAGPMAGLMVLPEDAKAMGAPPCEAGVELRSSCLHEFLTGLR